MQFASKKLFVLVFTTFSYVSNSGKLNSKYCSISVLLSLLFGFVFSDFTKESFSLNSYYKDNIFAVLLLITVCLRSLFVQSNELFALIDKDKETTSKLGFKIASFTFPFAFAFFSITNRSILFEAVCWLTMFNFGFSRFVLPLCLYAEALTRRKRRVDNEKLAICTNFKVSA